MPKGITSLTGFIRKIEDLQRSWSGDVFFRGHSNSNYELIPSIFRGKVKGFEREVIYRTISESPKQFDSDKYFFDKLVRAQHYGIPTRLLDVTSNPLFALYFSCCSLQGRGQVILLETPKHSTKFFMSDSISCKANLAQLTMDEKDRLLDAIFDSFYSVFGKNRIARRSNYLSEEEMKRWPELVEDFNKSAIVRRLVQFIREEKPYFQNIVDPRDLTDFQVVYPKKSNSRVTAQSGAFVVFGLRRALTEINMPSTNIKKSVIDIDEASKGSILSSLSAIGITESTVFPEFEKAASKIVAEYCERSNSG